QVMRVFEDIVAKGGTIIAGDDAFKLYDTYGFPADLTADVARERGLSVDMDGFERAMQAQRDRARAAGQFDAKGQISTELIQQLAPMQFLGYDDGDGDGLTVIAIVRDGQAQASLAQGEDAIVILDRTPFYGESGGQV